MQASPKSPCLPDMLILCFHTLNIVDVNSFCCIPITKHKLRSAEYVVIWLSNLPPSLGRSVIVDARPDLSPWKFDRYKPSFAVSFWMQQTKKDFCFFRHNQRDFHQTGPSWITEALLVYPSISSLKLYFAHLSNNPASSMHHPWNYSLQSCFNTFL